MAVKKPGILSARFLELTITENVCRAGGRSRSCGDEKCTGSGDGTSVKRGVDLELVQTGECRTDEACEVEQRRDCRSGHAVSTVR